MPDLPKSLRKREAPDEVGASHGSATGVWRVVRNGVLLAVGALLLVALFTI